MGRLYDKVMNIYLAGGISGNLSAAWKKLAKELEECAYILQEKTEKPECCEKSMRGGYEYISSRRASREERELLNNQGGARLLHS